MGGEARDGLVTERGVIRNVTYAGAVTRYEVELEAGGTLQAVYQNYETSSTEALDERGKGVEVGWRPDQAVPVDGVRETEDPR